MSEDAVTERPAWARNALFVLLAAALLAGAGVVGYALGNRNGPPATDSAEAGFARDMITHHSQAVRMAITARDRITDPTLRTICLDIITGQTGQIGAMQGWLDTWGLSQSDPDQTPMAWMVSGGHGSSDHGMAGMDGMDDQGAMPGMATPGQLADLEALSGRAAEVLFLQLMIKHHEGGVTMARAGVSQVEPSYEKQLARSILDSQTSEITAMQDLLRARGVTP
jgi:uncharacterized protein (DUF305 family)